MEDKLVTLAIHTFEKAQILKTMLETEGIEVYIHNVNQIQPVVSAGVRVRIKESDLPHALRIIEDSKWLSEDAEQEEKAGHQEKKILIPIDFSDYSIKACELGIDDHARLFQPLFPVCYSDGRHIGLSGERGRDGAECPEACPDRYGKHLYIDQLQDTLW